jgi:1-acyl-sn-glycerol-3-phosphate acyltransferase
MLPFKKGPFVLAIAAQVPVVPVYCAGTFDILPKGHLWLRPHPITIHFGDPIPTAGLTYDDRHQLLERTHQAVVSLRVQSDDAWRV